MQRIERFLAEATKKKESIETWFKIVALSSLLPRIASADQVTGTLCRVRNWVYTVALIVGVIYVVIAAVKYMTAGGGEGVKEANQALLYAVIGIAVALIAVGVPSIVSSLLPGGTTAPNPCQGVT